MDATFPMETVSSAPRVRQSDPGKIVEGEPLRLSVPGSLFVLEVEV